MGAVKSVFYDENSYLTAWQDSKNFDGDAGVLLHRELEYVIEEIARQETADETFSELGIRTDNKGGHASFIKKLKIGYGGGFKGGGTGNNSDGEITLTSEDDSIQSFLREANSSWSKAGLEEAKLGNIQLPSELILGHNVKYKTEIDTAGYIGVGKNKGILNYTGFQRETSAILAKNMSDNELYLKVRALLEKQRTLAKKKKFFATKLVTSEEIAIRLNGSDYKEAIDKSIAKKLKEDFNVDIAITHHAEKAGASDTELIVALCVSPTAINFRLPVRLTLSPIANQAHQFKFHSYFKIAGCDFSEDVSCILQGL